MKPIRYITILILPLLLSCEDLVEVDSPDDKLIQEVVFNSDETAISAMNGIYNQLFLTEFASGQRSSVTVLSGLSADNFKYINTNTSAGMQFEQHEILPDNSRNLEIWASAYNVVYMTNSFLKGLEESEDISLEIKAQLEGEARFIRAFTYFYLTNLYGDVPLILSIDYEDNRLASRTSSLDVFNSIVEDLEIAADILNPEYRSGERTRVNRYASLALLSRVYLYLEDWEKAELISSQVINENSIYELTDVNEVFLANSREAIWQISPIGAGGSITQTNEGSLFIIDPIFTFLASFKLDESFIQIFDVQDKRQINWIGYNEGMNAFFSFKYKIWSSNSFPILEYSMVLRLAEQYLIRAEARAEQGNLDGAISDLDAIRDRAGIEQISNTNAGISKNDLLDEIIKERRRELFAEWGHRWFDLKRTDKANAVLGSGDPYWEDTDVFYPIPEEERRKNTNLSQNPGY
ncbi:RagB/SusD family nutrient uptake outer membrane protein [uncultured Salegentibacter sp.]|uniref:RagB/SusD family nutrient uptake outer membrane protein n=1 Tax=uncultured Salegentibacter sp. TaxID=259320 RepID=UPI0030D731E0